MTEMLFVGVVSGVIACAVYDVLKAMVQKLR